MRCPICCSSAGVHADSRPGSGVRREDVHRGRFLRAGVGRVSGRQWTWTAAQRLPWQLTSSPLARRQFWGWPWNVLGPRAWQREEQDQRRDSALPLSRDHRSRRSAGCEGACGHCCLKPSGNRTRHTLQETSGANGSKKPLRWPLITNDSTGVHDDADGDN